MSTFHVVTSVISLGATAVGTVNSFVTFPGNAVKKSCHSVDHKIDQPAPTTINAPNILDNHECHVAFTQ